MTNPDTGEPWGLGDWLRSKADSGELPSQILDAARELNPGVEVSIEYDPTATLVVVTERGTMRFPHRAGEDWLLLFRRAGLL